MDVFDIKPASQINWWPKQNGKPITAKNPQCECTWSYDPTIASTMDPEHRFVLKLAVNNCHLRHKPA